MEGQLSIEGNKMLKDAFTNVSGIDEIAIRAIEESELFILQSPIEVAYKK